jgi:AcrR family transcriptional regulator
MSSESTIIPKRRHGTELESAILNAAWDELARTGYGGLTIEAVAERAGTSKTVLYRRWASKPELVIATIRSHRPIISGDVPNTGTLRGDVIALLERMTASISTFHRETMWALMSEVIRNRDKANFLYAEVMQSSTKAMSAIIEQAKIRKEFYPENIPKRILTLPIDLARNEILIKGTPLTKAGIIEIVDTIFLPLISPKQS